MSKKRKPEFGHADIGYRLLKSRGSFESNDGSFEAGNTIEMRFTRQESAKQEIAEMARLVDWEPETTDRGVRMVKRLVIVLEKKR